MKAYLSNKLNYRLNVVTQEHEMSTKLDPDSWEKIHVNELRDNLDRHGFEYNWDLRYIKIFFFL